MKKPTPKKMKLQLGISYSKVTVFINLITLYFLKKFPQPPFQLFFIG